MVEVLKKELSINFDDAVKHVEKIAKEEGFSILLVKSIDEILKSKLNLSNYRKYTIILACAPHLAKMALDVSVNVGTLFPCSFVVYEDEGKVIVAHTSIMKIAPVIGIAPKTEMAPVIEETGKYVHAAWDRF